MVIFGSGHVHTSKIKEKEYIKTWHPAYAKRQIDCVESSLVDPDRTGVTGFMPGKHE